MLKIYSQNGEQKAVVEPSSNSTGFEGIMQVSVLNLSFILADYVRLDVNDYIDYRQKRYCLFDDYRPEKVSDQEYKYNMKFYGPEKWLERALVLKLVDNENEGIFALTDNARVHLQLYIDNLNRIAGSNIWTIGEVVESDNITIEYDNKNCLVGISELAEKADTEWWVEGYTINLSRCEHGEQLVLGYRQGLQNLSKENNEKAPFFTRLYPVGSSRNIVRDDYGSPRLRLPGGVKYVEQNTQYGIFEHSEEEAFSHIYPRRVGRVGTVRSEVRTIDEQEVTIYYFKDPGLTFNPNKYEIAGLVKHIVYQSGPLNGYDFEANYNSDTGEFELITQYPYENLQLPGGSMVPEAGDEYILYNIKMPMEYYGLAEQEYLEAVQSFIEKYSIDTAAYKGKTDYTDLDQRGVELVIGRRTLLVSPEYFDEGIRPSRIISITRNIAEPNDADIECSHAVVITKIAAIESQVLQIQAVVSEQLNQSTDVQILKSWDNADPSEYNVFSARRSQGEFLSKRKSGEAQGYINFMRGIGLAAKLLDDILRVGDKADPSNQSVYSSLRTKQEIDRGLESMDNRFLRKDIEDTASKLIHFLKGIDVKDAARFHGSINSPAFVSGFVDGKGWGIRMQEYLNAAGETEQKSYAEFDTMTIRGALRVLEMIRSQVRGEADNTVSSGMMKVIRIDRAEQKIYLDTEGGLLYNPFRADDVLQVYQYNGLPSGDNDYTVTKSYELVVVAAECGDPADGENRQDLITYKNFTGDESVVSQGDFLVRMDNLTNPDRKGILMNTTVGPFAPYTDVVYGLKTDPSDAVKARFGNLSGIYNHWFGWLKGFGAYVQNLYAVGEFHFKNGENIQTSLEVMKNLFRVDMQQTIYNLTEADNFLCNAAFTGNMDGWSRANDIRVFTVGGKLLMANGNLYANKEAVTAVVDYEGRNMLRIKNSGIRQANALIRKPEEGTTLYLSFKFICQSPGTLTVGFERAGQAAEGDLPFVVEEIAAGMEFETRTYAGLWDGAGDFAIRFTGDIYIDLLSVTHRPLDELRIEVGTRFDQTAEQISLLGSKVDGIGHTTSELGITLGAMDERIDIWAEKTDQNTRSVTQLGIDLDLAGEQLQLYADKTDNLDSTVASLGLRMSAAEGDIELFSQFKNLAGGQITELGIRLDGVDAELGLFAERHNQLSGEMISVGARLSAAEGELELYADQYDLLTGEVTSIGSRMDTVEGKFVNYVLSETFTDAIDRQWTAIELQNNDILLSVNRSTGFPIYKDQAFETGANGLLLYNQPGGSAVTLKRLEIYYGAYTPTASNYPASTWTTAALKEQHVGEVFKCTLAGGPTYTYSAAYTWVSGTPEFGGIPSGNPPAIVRIKKTAGNSAPGLGGFTWASQSRERAVFEARFTAKIPQGYSLNFYPNAPGDGAVSKWLTGTAGTGGWKEYRHQVLCGTSGYFGATDYFYLTQDGSTDDYSTAVTWYLRSATVFDLSGYEDPITYINLSPGLARIKAERIELEGTVTANGTFKIDTNGSIEATGGKIGGIQIANGWLGVAASPGGTSGLAGLSLCGDFIKFSNGYNWVSIGVNVLPGISGQVGVGQFTNATPTTGTNYGLLIDVRGGRNNLAIAAKGDVVVEGDAVGYGFTTLTPPANAVAPTDSSGNLSMFRIIARFTNNGGGLAFPMKSAVRNKLGITSTAVTWAVKMTIIGSADSTVSGSIRGRAAAVPELNSAEYPKKLDNNAAWDQGEHGIAKGDVLEFMLAWDGTEYYAYLLNSRN